MSTKTKSTTSTAINPPRLAKATIRGLSPLTQGKAHAYGEGKRAEDETGDEQDERMWRDRAHYNQEGLCVIPASALHKALVSAAKFRGETIPGEGKKTWTKRFGAGIMILEHAAIDPPTNRETVSCVIVHVPTGGQPGGTTRVYRRFPIFESWSATVEVTVVDGLISEEVFARHLETAGKFVGLGTHRPSSLSPGTNGRFAVEGIEWSEID